MFFFAFGCADIWFTKNLFDKIYMIVKALPTNKRMELYNLKGVVIATLGDDDKNFYSSVLEVKNVLVIIFTIFGIHHCLLYRLYYDSATQVHWYQRSFY